MPTIEMNQMSDQERIDIVVRAGTAHVVACPWCGAEPGRACHTKDERRLMTSLHDARARVFLGLPQHNAMAFAPLRSVPVPLAIGDRVVDRYGAVGVIVAFVSSGAWASVKYDAGGHGDRRSEALQRERLPPPPPKFAVGDRVVVRKWSDRGCVITRINALGESGGYNYDCGFRDKNGYELPVYESLLEPAPEPKPLKLKVGDRVRASAAGLAQFRDGASRFAGVITSICVEGAYVHHVEGRAVHESFLELAPIGDVGDNVEQWGKDQARSFAPGDLVRVKPASRHLARRGEPETMTVERIAADGVVEMAHRLGEDKTGAPWAAEHLELEVSNGKCLRCGAPAFTGLFSSKCLRSGGCSTAEQRVNKRVDLGEHHQRIAVCYLGREPRWMLVHQDEPTRYYPTIVGAFEAWRERALAEERGR